MQYVQTKNVLKEIMLQTMDNVDSELPFTMVDVAFPKSINVHLIPESPPLHYVASTSETYMYGDSDGDADQLMNNNNNENNNPENKVSININSKVNLGHHLSISHGIAKAKIAAKKVVNIDIGKKNIINTTKLKNDIPESMIAQNLRAKLQNVLRLQNLNGTGININSQRQKSKIEEQKAICNHIIDAFKKLYYKYVGKDYAIFMINISSQNRKKLTHLFNNEVYQKELRQASRTRSRSASTITKSLSNRFKSINSSTSGSKGSIGVEPKSGDLSHIDVNLKKFIQTPPIISENENVNVNLKGNVKENGNENGNGDVNNINNCNQVRDSVEWLLYQIFHDFEPAAKEISKLTHGSFIRFKTTERTLYHKLCIDIANNEKQKNSNNSDSKDSEQQQQTASPSPTSPLSQG